MDWISFVEVPPDGTGLALLKFWCRPEDMPPLGRIYTLSTIIVAAVGAHGIVQDALLCCCFASSAGCLKYIGFCI
jgi:hypothetical protein